MLPEFSSSAPSWSTHVMRHSQQAIESDSSYVLASLKCLYYVVHVFLILNIHNIHYHGVDLRWKHFLWISKLVTFEWFYNLIPFQTKTIFNHINHDKRGFRAVGLVIFQALLNSRKIWRDVALCRKLPRVPANLMIFLKQRRSYLVIKIGKKTTKHSPWCAKIIP